MAIMRTCCCCGVRQGSIACGVYSMIVAILGGIVFSLDLINLPAMKEALYEAQLQNPEIFGDLDIDGYVCASKVSYIFALVVNVSVFFTSIFVFVGINQDSKGMLIPFVVSKGVAMLWYMFGFSLCIYALVKIGVEIVGIGIIAYIVVIGPFFLTDVVCMLCVVSQYQEYRDGRGRLSDTVATQRQTTVIIQQQMPQGTAGFGYQPMQNPPPPAYYPAPAVEAQKGPGPI